jgi:hypothetical protein
MPTTNRGLENDHAHAGRFEHYEANAWAELLEVAALHESTALDLAGSSTHTATAAEYDSTVLLLTGLLTGNRILELPLDIAGRFWLVHNGTTGDYTVTLQGVTGNGVTLTRGMRAVVYTDGTDFFLVGSQWLYSAAASRPAAAATGAGTWHYATDTLTLSYSDGSAWTTILDPSGAVSVSAKTSNYTLTDSDDVILGDTTSGNVTLTLPAAASRTGRRYTVIKTVAANSLIIDGNGAETISGAATQTLTQRFHALNLVCDGSGWCLEAEYNPAVSTLFATGSTAGHVPLSGGGTSFSFGAIMPSGTLANRPSAATNAGRPYLVTTGARAGWLFVSDGSNWLRVNGPQGTLPIDLFTASSLWFAADTIYGTAHNAILVTWPGIGGYGHVLTPSSGLEPILVRGDQNRLPGVQFDGSADNAVTSGFSWSAGLASLYFNGVFSIDSLVNTDVYLNTGSNRFRLAWVTGNLLRVYFNATTIYAEIAWADTNPHSLRVAYNGAGGAGNDDKVKIYKDRTAMTPAWTGTVPATLDGSSNLTLGAVNAAGSSGGACTWHEFTLAPGITPALAVQENLEDYLMSKWGL